jgi:aspartyl protease family protein
MTPERNPWNRDRQDDGPPQGGGLPPVWRWLLVLVVVVGGIWLLFEAFPERRHDSSDLAQLVKLTVILVVCASGVVFLRHTSIWQNLKYLVIWVAIGGLLLVGYAYRDVFSDVGSRVAGELLPGRAVEVGDGIVEIRAGRDGHFTVTAEVNGAPVTFLVDTGASDIVLSPADAERVGYDPARLSFTQRYHTANGIGRGAPVRLDTIAVGPIAFDRMPASVNEAPMGESLLGMSFLRELSSYEVRGDVLILRR